MKRRTRKQKIKAQKDRQQREIVGFRVDVDSVGLSEKSLKQTKMTQKVYGSYLRADLTKTMRLTMLAIALELALWQFAFR